jgi:hypothetical protein
MVEVVRLGRPRELASFCLRVVGANMAEENTRTARLVLQATVC